MFAPRVAVKVLAAFWLAAALLVAQTLGFVHGLAHNGALSPVHAHALAACQADKALHDHAGDDLLFAGHGGEMDCRLYDQASHGGMMPLLVMPTLPVVLPPFEVAIFQGEALARWAALFDARGPPLTV
jgi:hypothetical protein